MCNIKVLNELKPDFSVITPLLAYRPNTAVLVHYYKVHPMLSYTQRHRVYEGWWILPSAVVTYTLKVGD
jgi:hypothetical protein